MIGSQLKILLASKTIVFCGYSLRDRDFQEIMDFVRNEMKGFIRQPYIVTLDGSPEAVSRYEQFGLHPIITDATHFLSVVKSAHKELGYYVDDGMHDACRLLLSEIETLRAELLDKINLTKHPTVIFTLFYYDGLIHGLERIVSLRKSGPYSHPGRSASRIEGYKDIRSKLVKLKKYDDVAYVDGYIYALIFSATYENTDELDPPPPYYSFGAKQDIRTFANYKAAIGHPAQIHNSSYVWAKKLLSRMKDANGTQLIPSHKCTLSWPK